MADSKEIKIQAGIDFKPSAKYEQMFKNLSKSANLAFDANLLKNYNKQLNEVAKTLGKMGINFKDMGKVAIETQKQQQAMAKESLNIFSRQVSRLDELKRKSLDPNFQANFIQKQEMLFLGKNPQMGLREANQEAQRRWNAWSGQVGANYQGAMDAAMGMADEQKLLRQSRLRKAIGILQGVNAGVQGVGSIAQDLLTYDQKKLRYEAGAQSFRTDILNRLAGGGGAGDVAAMMMAGGRIGRIGENARMGYNVGAGASILGNATTLATQGVVGYMTGGLGYMLTGGPQATASAATGITSTVSDMMAGKGGAVQSEAQREALANIKARDPYFMRWIEEAQSTSLAKMNYERMTGYGYGGGWSGSKAWRERFGNNYSMSLLGKWVEAESGTVGGSWQDAMRRNMELASMAGTGFANSSRTLGALYGLNNGGINPQRMGVDMDSATRMLGQLGFARGGNAAGATKEFEDVLKRAYISALKDPTVRQTAIENAVAASTEAGLMGKRVGGAGNFIDLLSEFKDMFSQRAALTANTGSAFSAFSSQPGLRAAAFAVARGPSIRRGLGAHGQILGASMDYKDIMQPGQPVVDYFMGDVGGARTMAYENVSDRFRNSFNLAMQMDDPRGLLGKSYRARVEEFRKNNPKLYKDIMSRPGGESRLWKMLIPDLVQRPRNAGEKAALVGWAHTLQQLPEYANKSPEEILTGMGVEARAMELYQNKFSRPQMLPSHTVTRTERPEDDKSKTEINKDMAINTAINSMKMFMEGIKPEHAAIVAEVGKGLTTMMDSVVKNQDAAGTLKDMAAGIDAITNSADNFLNMMKSHGWDGGNRQGAASPPKPRVGGG